MNKEKQNPDNIKYGIIAYTIKGNHQKPQISVLHFCGYEAPPTDADLKALELELSTTEEFGLMGRINNDVLLMTLDEYSTEQIKKSLDLDNTM